MIILILISIMIILTLIWVILNQDEKYQKLKHGNLYFCCKICGKKLQVKKEKDNLFKIEPCNTCAEIIREGIKNEIREETEEDCFEKCMAIVSRKIEEIDINDLY